MSLTRHSVLNLIGAAVPICVAIPAVAVLARVLGIERFALVTLAWALVGYAGVFDLGLSRAVVRVIAMMPADNAAHRVTLSSATWLVTAVSSLACGALLLGASPLVTDVLKVSPAFTAEAVHGFVIVALSIPLLLPTLVVQGYWDGVENFVEANIQRIVGGSLVPVMTAVGALMTPTFEAAMLGLFAARLLTLALALARGRVFTLLPWRSFSRERCVDLLRFGGWVTASNVISPLMGYLDRYILAYVRGASVVGFYAAPSEVTLKLLALPVAVTRSLFPKLVDSVDTVQRDVLLRQSTRLVAISCVPIALLIAVAAPWILLMWLGPEYAHHSAAALQILMLGFVFCAFAQIPFTEIHAYGRADLTARIHLFEVGPFLLVAYVLASRYGVVGAAAAWTMRNLADYLLLSFVAKALRS